MKQWRKWMAAGLTAVMAVSTAACGGTGGTDSASSGEEQTNFSIFAGISALSPDNSEKPLVQQMNEAMGVTIEWNCVSGDTLTEKKNLILNAGSDLPDALMAASLTDSELLTYGGNGLLIPLEDYINEETMPNLMKIVEKRPEMLATCTMPDGHIYGLPGISEMGFEYTDGNTYYIGAIPQFTAINTDWLEAVGMEMPTTVDELHDVLVAFRDQDVNGNGDPTDEEVMEEAGIENCDAFISAADDDEQNILACIMAKRRGAKKVIAITHKPEYIRIVPAMEAIDCGISSTLVSVNTVLRMIETGTMRIDAKLQRFHAHLTEFRISRHSPLAGKEIRECNLPPSAVFALIFRGFDVLTASGTTVLEPEDTVVTIVTPESKKDLEPLFPD